MSYKWPGIPNGDYSFDHGRAIWNRIINYLRRLSEKLDADIVDATADRRGMMTAADKDKLDGVEPGAEVNQNAFSGVKVGSSTIEADSKTDVLELGAGTNISLTVDTTNGKVTITNTYEHPTYTARTGKPTQNLTPGFGDTVTISQIVSDGTGHVTAANDKTITIPSTEATQSAAGLMSATDKTKLDGIASEAEVNQNSFAIVKVGATNITADAKQDTLTLIEGSNVTLSPNATNDSITISATDTIYSDFIASGSSAAHGLVPKPPTTAGMTKYLREDGTWQVPPDNNTTYPAFATSNTIAEDAYRDAMVMYDAETSNRASVIRVTNGSGFHEILIGVNNESNGAPSGLSVRSTNGAITASLGGILTVNGIKIGTANIGSATTPVYINSGSITACDISPASATPQTPGTGAVGTSNKYARENHQHPLERFVAVGQNGVADAKVWYKVASITATTGYYNPEIIFLVTTANSGATPIGILKIKPRWNSNPPVFSTPSTVFSWVINNGFPLSDFVLVNPTADPNTVELWVKLSNNYDTRIFTVLSEGAGSTRDSRWTFYPAMSNGQASAPTTGAQITSQYGSESAVSSVIDTNNTSGHSSYLKFGSGLVFIWGSESFSNTYIDITKKIACSTLAAFAIDGEAGSVTSAPSNLHQVNWARANSTNTVERFVTNTASTAFFAYFIIGKA